VAILTTVIVGFNTTAELHAVFGFTEAILQLRFEPATSMRIRFKNQKPGF